MFQKTVLMKYIIFAISLLFANVAGAQIVNTLPATLSNTHVICGLPDTINVNVCVNTPIYQGTAPDIAADSITIYYKIGDPCCFFNDTPPACCVTDSTTAPPAFSGMPDVEAYIRETFGSDCTGVDVYIYVKNHY